MWSTITSLKENITQIASDVLDTAQELESGGNYVSDGHVRDGLARPPGPAAEFVQLNADRQLDPERDAQLNWYKNEVRRLAAAESQIQALSVNYVSLLKEKEEEVRALRMLNEELRANLASNDAERETKDAANSQNEIEQLKRQNASLMEELQLAGDAQQEQFTALQDHHKKRMDALVARHKRELAATQAQAQALAQAQAQVEAHTGANSHLLTEGKSSLGAKEAEEEVEERIRRSEAVRIEQVRQLEKQLQSAQEKEKELMGQVAEKDNLYGRLKDAHERMRMDVEAVKESLDKERASADDINRQLERAQDAAAATARECNMLKGERQHMRAEWAEARKQLEELQAETANRMKMFSANNEKQRADLQAERDALQKALDFANEELERAHLRLKTEALPDSDGLSNGVIVGHAPAIDVVEIESQAEEVRQLTEMLATVNAEAAKQKEELEKKMVSLAAERDKAVRDLARLKQHLLDKEHAESEKMDEDKERIGELEERARIGQERAAKLSEALAELQVRADDERSRTSEELLSLRKEVVSLRTDLAECMKVVELKDTEVVNLQSALGAFYAESDTQERLIGELAVAKETITKLTKELKVEKEAAKSKEAEKSTALASVHAAESKLVESQKACVKLQDDVSRLRKALEHSMTRLNRMSTDSDFYVDRRIVIKLLVTFFQRNHSREVLELMARMLGFTDEDKQRVGLAQQATSRTGMLRGVLGASGRFVGGFIGGSGVESSSSSISEDKEQSFTDLWIDFLVKESQGQQAQGGSVQQASGERSVVESAKKTGTGFSSEGHVSSSRKAHSKSYSELALTPRSGSAFGATGSYPSSPIRERAAVLGFEVPPFTLPGGEHPRLSRPPSPGGDQLRLSRPPSPGGDHTRMSWPPSPGRDHTRLSRPPSPGGDHTRVSRPPSRDGGRAGAIPLPLDFGSWGFQSIGSEASGMVRNISTGDFTPVPLHSSSSQLALYNDGSLVRSGSQGNLIRP